MCSRVLSDTKVWGCPTSSGRPATEKQEGSRSFESRSSLKMLELSKSMHPQYISFQVFLALNSTAYNGLSCHGLDMRILQEKDGESAEHENSSEDSPTPYLKHLKLLIHSRKWLRLEFHRCLGVELLVSMSEEAVNGGDKGNDRLEEVDTQQITEVEHLVLKFRKSSQFSTKYDEKRHRDFFLNLWSRWKVQQLTIAMDFTPESTKAFCRHGVSVLEELEISPECTWHRPPNTTARTDAVESDLNVDHGDENDEKDETNAIEDFDCWELFCRELRTNHPRLKVLEIHCKTSDSELAYLIDHAIASTAKKCHNSRISSSVLPMEKLFFGKLCSCDIMSLLALSRVLTSCSARRWKSLTISRGFKLPSRAVLDAGLPLPPRPADRRGLLEFCRCLKHATDLTRLNLADYILDEVEMGALFESLVLASGRIEKLSLFGCAATSNEVYETVLCGSTYSGENKESSFTPYLILNQLPNLQFLHLPREALKALCKVLKSNTSIEFINNHGRTKTHEFYLDLNRGGRRILTASVTESDGVQSAIPPTLWPNVLELASTDIHPGLKKDRYCGGKNRKYDVVYHLLRNRILLELN